MEYETKLEKVQKSFLRYYLKNEPFIEDYELMCKHAGIEPLQVRRKISSIMICFKLLIGKVDCPNILGKLNLNCPSVNLRRPEMLRPQRRTTNYAFFEPINLMMMSFNEISDIFDYNLTENNFKKSIRDFFSQI